MAYDHQFICMSFNKILFAILYCVYRNNFRIYQGYFLRILFYKYLYMYYCNAKNKSIIAINQSFIWNLYCSVLSICRNNKKKLILSVNLKMENVRGIVLIYTYLRTILRRIMCFVICLSSIMIAITIVYSVGYFNYNKNNRSTI